MTKANKFICFIPGVGDETIIVNKINVKCTYSDRVHVKLYNVMLMLFLYTAHPNANAFLGHFGW